MNEITTDILDEVTEWHFAVGGLQTKTDSIEMSGAIHIQRLKVFPTEAELAFSLNNPLVAGIMQHYGEDVIQHELVIKADTIDDAEDLFLTAHVILAGLRIRTEAEIICPALCQTSWAGLRGISGKNCHAYRFEPAMYSHDFGAATLITSDDIEWVRDNLGKLVELNKDQRFQTAIEALCSYLHAANYRMMAAQLWAGVEAIFEVRYEISFRLPLLAALLLEKRGPECRDLRKKIKKLYNERSTAVHGGDVSEEKLQTHVSEVRTLLAKLLATIIKRGQLPTKDDFDDLTVMHNEHIYPDES